MNNFQFALVFVPRRQWVGADFQKADQLKQLVQHAEDIRAAAAGGVNDFDGFELRDQLAGVFFGDAVGGALVHQFRVAAQISLERFPAHELDNAARRVIRPGAMSVARGDQFLENFAEHFRVHSHLHIVGRAFGNREVVVIEELGDDRFQGFVPDQKAGMASGLGSVFGVVKKTAV